ncbi:MAG: hypothetical protein ACREPB_03380, partial [Arenimonas sp.]
KSNWLKVAMPVRCHKVWTAWNCRRLSDFLGRAELACATQMKLNWVTPDKDLQKSRAMPSR